MTEETANYTSSIRQISFSIDEETLNMLKEIKSYYRHKNQVITLANMIHKEHKFIEAEKKKNKR